VLRAVPYLFTLLLAARVIAAARFDLFGDEAFYWMCSRRLAPAFVDHPFLTALLMRAGSELLGATPLGARLAFLLVGALLPAGVYVLARPLAGARDAMWAAGATLLVPVLAVAGVVAVPDVPLALCAVLALAGFERATRTGGLGAWAACGVACGIALTAHVRGVLIPLSFLVYLCATARGRAAWRQPGLWLAALLAATGTLPLLAFNASLGFAPLRWQLLDRHAVEVAWSAPFAHLLEQALVVTPPLYLALLASFVWLIRRAARGDDRAALLACFAGVHLGVYLLASPFSDREHVMLHWPAAGYLPLLVALPSALRQWTAPRAAHGRRALAVGTVGFAALSVALLHLELATGVFGSPELKRAFGGWEAAARAVEEELKSIGDEGRAAGGRSLLVADDYLLAGNLELRFPDALDLYVLDHPKHVQHGRALQLRLWQIDEAGLRQRAGESGLLVLDRDQVENGAWWSWLRHASSRFDTASMVATVGERRGRAGDPRFFLLRAQGVRADPPAAP
jgi:hypothetical protein